MPSFSFFSFSSGSSKRAGKIFVICRCPSGRWGKGSVAEVGTRSKFGKGLRERGADALANHQIGIIVLVGWGTVKNRELGAISFGHERKTGGWINHQRGAQNQEQIAP